MVLTDVVVALVVALGLIGILVPVLPGSLLVAAGLVGWAFVASTTAGWVVVGVCLALLAAGAVTKYAVPGRRLRRSGTPTSTLVAGGAVGVVGFFVVPVVGLVLGFVLGIYLAELHRLRDQGGHRAAWPATTRALRAVGLSVLIELAAALLAAVAWGVAVLAGAGG